MPKYTEATMVKNPNHPSPATWKALRPAVQEMRAEPTRAEQILWRHLRDRRLNGLKFRRQHAIDRFVVDFFCREAALIIEVDGPIHNHQRVEDVEREQILLDYGFSIMRFTNQEVFENIDSVLAKITETAAQKRG